MVSVPHPNNFMSQPKKLTHLRSPTSTSTSTSTLLYTTSTSTSTSTLLYTIYTPPLISSLLQQCSTIEEVHQLHTQMLKSGTMNNPLLLTNLISSYILIDIYFTLHFISSLSHHNHTVWNTLIKELSLGSNPKQSILLFMKMLQGQSLNVDSHVFPSILKACSRFCGIFEGTQIHGLAIKVNSIANPYVGNALILMYHQCGKLCDGRKVFDSMTERSVRSWNIIIMAYAEMGCWEDVKSLFWSMVEWSSFVPDSITLVRMITACTRTRDLESGRWVRGYVEGNGVEISLYLANALMNMYVKNGDVGEARQLFDGVASRDVVSWTTLVSGYAGSGLLGSARELFDRMPERNVVAWNAMIAGYVLNSYFKEAFLLFKSMLVAGEKPDNASVASVVQACVGLEDLFSGKIVHGYVIKGGIEMTLDLMNSIIGMYSKFGSLDCAELLFKTMPIRNEISWTLIMVCYVKSGAKEVAIEIFRKMPDKDIVSWNALISILVQCDHSNEALGIFQEMLRNRVCPNGLTLASTLSACSRTGALELGKWIHSYIERKSIEMDDYLVSSIIDMYAKCGRIDLSLEVFIKISSKDTLTWSTIISGLAMHGHAELALELFQKMLDDGVQPDGITFLGVLSACNHTGLVEEGRHYFSLMTQGYKISPSIEHYSCMVDLLGRKGLLSKAKDFVKGVARTSKENSIWRALLGACRLNSHVELAEYAAKQLFEADSSSSGAFVLLSNTYATASNWDGVKKIRKMMKGKGVQKLPGCSSIEVDGVVHEFFVRDISHPQCEEIYVMIHDLEKQMACIDQTKPQY